MAQTTKNRVGSTIVLGLHLAKHGIGVTGQHPTVELRRVSDSKYFDWAAIIDPFWVVSGGTRLGTLPEAAYLPGLYQRQWAQGDFDTGPQDYLLVFRNVGPDYAVEEVEVQSFTFEWADDVEFLRKVLTNKTVLEMLSPTHYRQRFFDNDKATVIKTDDIVVVGAEETREPI